MDRIWSFSQPEQDEGQTNHRRITPELIEMIEEALVSLGEYGEVRLIVARGRLRYIVTSRSHDVMKWQPGSLVEKIDK